MNVAVTKALTGGKVILAKVAATSSAMSGLGGVNLGLGCFIFFAAAPASSKSFSNLTNVAN